MGKYDRNLIVSLLPGQSTQLLELKCKEKNALTDVVIIGFDRWGDILPFSIEDKAKFRRLTGASRLYFHGHGDKGYDGIANNNRDTVSSKLLAEMIACNVNLNTISGLRIRLFSCSSAIGSSPTTNNSLAARLAGFLRLYGIYNVQVVGTSDLVTLIQNPHTKKIYSYLFTDIENNIHENASAGRAKILLQAKLNFFSQIRSSELPCYLDEEALRYMSDNLSVEIMANTKKLNDFMAHFCGYILHRGVLSQANSHLLIWFTMTLAQVNETLRTTVYQHQSIAFDRTMRALKQANYARPGAKLMFQWDGERSVTVDCFEGKRSSNTPSCE